MSQTKTFQYNGQEYTFDIADADDAEKFEKAVGNLQKADVKREHDGRLSETIIYQCQILRAFFDDVFGAASGVKICGDKNNLSVCMEAYKSFLEYVKEQKRGITNVTNTFGQYSNRAQRRNQGKGGKNKNGNRPNLKLK